MDFGLPPVLASGFTIIAFILGAMALVGLVEILIPFRSQKPWSWKHLTPNLGLTLITFATNIVFNSAVVLGLAWLQGNGLGLLNVVEIPPLWAVIIVVLVLDFSFYVAQIAMHKVPLFWRVHRVHHSDPAVDVTTTIRQHPFEGVIRYACIALFAFPIGANPEAFAVYRVWSALNGLLEHANIRIPPWLDRSLSWVTTWPGMHKIHHAREPHLTDTNYGNIFSLWDRLFFTFMPAKQAVAVSYGLHGFDRDRQQSLIGLLAAPFAELDPRRDDARPESTRPEPAV